MSAIKHANVQKNQRGFVMTSELVLITTTMIIGLTTGLITMRDAVNAEMEDVAEAIGHLDQTYAFDGIVNAQKTAAIEGSVYGDATDTNAGDDAEFTFVAATALEGGATAASLGSSAAANTGTVNAP